ncbi:MAG: glucose-6-phosphate dehydrogenase [Candidatus Rokuibacteriota bacterium]
MASDPHEYLAQSLGQAKKPHACVVTIFGASGDLTKRKLIPALYNLALEKRLPERFAVVGYARSEMSDEAFRDKMRAAVKEFSRTGLGDEAAWQEFANTLYYMRGGYEEDSGYEKLKQFIENFDRGSRTLPARVFYLAIPPDIYGTVIERISAAGLTPKETDREPRSRVVIEKPFGTDLETARELNRRVHEALGENQIYRIDHYLGKETVQNIMVFRFANAVFEPIWNRRYVDHVQMLVAETVGVEDRGNYYETAGVLRDMIQNHMFQVLALIAMEPPASFDPDAVRDEKVKVLKSIRPMTPEEVLQRTVRGQYGEGTLAGKKVHGYRTEGKVSPTSGTETYAALKLFVENWRWAGIPFYLRSGKRLAKRDTEVVIQFRRPPLLLFEQSTQAEIEPNRLVLHIQPDEGIEVQMKAKQPGPTVRLNTVKLTFSYKDFGEQGAATGYERLLYDGMIGDSTLFHRADMVEAAWKIATPMLDVWKSLPPRDFPNYAAGSWGPQAADAMLEQDGRRWWVSA